MNVAKVGNREEIIVQLVRIFSGFNTCMTTELNITTDDIYVDV